jgi:hypothetical protein
VQAAANGFRADNQQHALSVEFTSEGVQMRTATARWGFALEGYGYGNTLLEARGTAPRASRNRVEYRRSAITEWYTNGPLGLEQGFTLEEPPGKAHGRPLTIAIALSGELTASVDPGGKSLTLVERDGQAELRYAGLTAYDAKGRELHAWLELQSGRLLLRVEDASARYPIVVDPFVQQAKLASSDGAAGNHFGWSVAISGDTAVVGAPVANSGAGAAYVFVKPVTGWATTSAFTAKLSASGGAFGSSVAISGDTLVVVAPQQSSAYVFVKPVGGWAMTSTFSAELTASDAGAGFGSSVGISGDSVVVGAALATVAANSEQGAAYVFVKPSFGWMGALNETAKLTASDGAASDWFGYSVAISGDTVVVGTQPYSAGAVYIFTKPGAGWATGTETAKLTASDGVAGDAFGFSVANSGDTVAVGAVFAKSAGAAYVFVKPTGGWATTSTFNAELVPSDGQLADYFGASVAVDGDSVVVGNACFLFNFAIPNIHTKDTCGPTSTGAAYVFAKPGTGWTSGSESAKLTASDASAAHDFGFSLAISGDTLLVGAAYADIASNSSQGGAYVFETGPGLIGNVIGQAAAAGCIDNAGIGSALTSKLTAAQTAISAGNIQMAVNILTALENQIQAQIGKHVATTCTVGGVTFNPITVLLGDVQSLINSLSAGAAANPITGTVVNSSSMGIPGVTVGIIDGAGKTVATAITDITGFYLFATTSILAPGAAYTIKVVAFPTGYSTSVPALRTFTWGGSAMAFNFAVN